jgi:cobaltochelatase CobS
MDKKTFDVADAFGVNKFRGMRIEGYEKPQTNVPKQQAYRFRKDTLAPLAMWWMAPEHSGLYLHGPTGSGKTSLVKQFAARINVPVFSVTGHADMELGELLGQYTLIEGTTVWMDGPLTTAARHGGILLVNEVDLIRPGVLTGLNEVRDRGELVLTENGGERVSVNPDFRLVLTANTAGLGDETGGYLGTGRMNVAFLDGFAVAEVGYPTVRDESKILAELSIMAEPLKSQLAGQMIRFARETREAFAGGKLSAPLTTRGVLRWLDYTWSVLPAPAGKKETEDQARTRVKRAMEVAVNYAYLGRLPTAEQTAAKETMMSVGMSLDFEDKESASEEAA